MTAILERPIEETPCTDTTCTADVPALDLDEFLKVATPQPVTNWVEWETKPEPAQPSPVTKRAYPLRGFPALPADVRQTLTINVTQDDIDHGRFGSSAECPIARATVRLLAGIPFVSSGAIALTGGSRVLSYQLPSEARAFVRAFDRQVPVQPFTFTAELVDVQDNVSVVPDQTLISVDFVKPLKVDVSQLYASYTTTMIAPSWNAKALLVTSVA